MICENCEHELMLCSNCSNDFEVDEEIMCNKRESGNEHFCELCIGVKSTVLSGGKK